MAMERVAVRPDAYSSPARKAVCLRQDTSNEKRKRFRCPRQRPQQQMPSQAGGSTSAPRNFGVRWHARLCIGVRRLCVPVPQEDWRRTAAERIEAGAQATVEDRFVPSGEIVLLAGKSPVIHHRAPHAFADGGASSKAAPSERSALRSRSPRRIIITPKTAA